MSIRLLGAASGSWEDGDILTAEDLNDTFEETAYSTLVHVNIFDPQTVVQGTWTNIGSAVGYAGELRNSSTGSEDEVQWDYFFSTGSWKVGVIIPSQGASGAASVAAIEFDGVEILDLDNNVSGVEQQTANFNITTTGSKTVAVVAKTASDIIAIKYVIFERFS